MESQRAIMTAATASQPAAGPAVSGIATRRVAVLLALLVLLAGVSFLRLFVGEQFNWPEQVILETRGKRLILGLVVGAALAASGVSLQGLLRNPLAEPFILGLSTGAAMGVMGQMLLAQFVSVALGGPHLGALVGALISMGIVYVGGHRRGVIDPLGLLLVGVVLSTINGAIIMLINYAVGPAGLREDLSRWMMGFLNESVGMTSLWVVGSFTLAGIAVLAWRGPQLDAASFSDAEALSLGIDLRRLRVLLFTLASVLAAGSVVLAGPVAFVGLICPHIARLMLGPSHRSLVLASAMLGSLLVLASDMVSVALDWQLHWGRMPVGVFTSLVGGPVFLWMLRPQLGRGQDI